MFTDLTNKPKDRWLRLAFNETMKIEVIYRYANRLILLVPFVWFGFFMILGLIVIGSIETLLYPVAGFITFYATSWAARIFLYFVMSFVMNIKYHFFVGMLVWSFGFIGVLLFLIEAVNLYSESREQAFYVLQACMSPLGASAGVYKVWPGNERK